MNVKRFLHGSFLFRLALPALALCSYSARVSAETIMPSSRPIDIETLKEMCGTEPNDESYERDTAYCEGYVQATIESVSSQRLMKRSFDCLTKNRDLLAQALGDIIHDNRRKMRFVDIRRFIINAILKKCEEAR